MHYHQWKKDHHTIVIFFDRMAQITSRRYHLNAWNTPRDVYDLDPDFPATGPDLEFAIHNRDRILAVFTDSKKFNRFLDFFVNLIIEFTYANNQFIQITPREEAILREI